MFVDAGTFIPIRGIGPAMLFDSSRDRGGQGLGQAAGTVFLINKVIQADAGTDLSHDEPAYAESPS
jgi:hypothetical protein